MNSFESFKRSASTSDTNPEILPQVPTPELLETQESAHELLHSLDALKGFTKLHDQKRFVDELADQDLIVRREDPDKLLQLLSTGEPISLSFVGGTPYANSVEWNPKTDGPRGIDNAYLEGYSHKNNVVTVYGFKKPAEFFLEKLADSQAQFAGVNRSRVRAAAGFVTLDSIEFVTVRMPIHALSEDELTEAEKDQLYEYEEQEEVNRKPVFAYRTYLRKEEKPTAH